MFKCSKKKKNNYYVFKILPNNDTMKLVLFSTVESNILTNKKNKMN